MANSDLFRKEALEHSKDRLFGDVILLQPFSMAVMVATVLVITLVLLAVLFWGNYSRKQTVQGFLVPTQGVVKMYMPQAGSISVVHIKEGEQVSKGQPLVTILTERTLQGGGDIDSLILQELNNTRKQNLQKIELEKSLQRSEDLRLHNQLQGYNKELQQIEESITTQRERLGILETRVKGAHKLLQQKNLSGTEYDKLYEEMLVQKQQLQDLERAKVNKENALIQTQAEIEQLPLKFESRIKEIENSLSELNQREAEINGHKVYEIRAPIDGTITALQAQLGQWQSNAPLLSILPKDAELQVELYVPSRAIGFVEPGQKVNVRYEAFPYQRYGVYQGEVVTVSKHVLMGQELPIPMESNEPVYRVIIRLDKQSVQAYGKDLPLQAGMSLEADIILDKQTLMEWIFDPLLSLKGRFA